jgi:hypothetical protein
MHGVLVEDAQGDLVDIHYYCSDWCARTDPLYNGWNGCNEIEFGEKCQNCGADIAGTQDYINGLREDDPLYA